MCELSPGSKAILRFLKVPSLCLITLAVVWLEEMSPYFAFDFSLGLITPPLSLHVHAYLFFPLPFFYTQKWNRALKKRNINGLIRLVMFTPHNLLVPNAVKHKEIQWKKLKRAFFIIWRCQWWLTQNLSTFHMSQDLIRPLALSLTSFETKIQKYTYEQPFFP